MEWNVLWYQAMTYPALGGLLTKKEQTVEISVPVRQKGSGLRLRLANRNEKKPNFIKISVIYKDAIYPVTLGGKKEIALMGGSVQYTDEIAVSLETDTELKLRIYYKQKFKDCNNTEECTELYQGDATEIMEAKRLPQSDFEIQYGMFRLIPYVERIEVASDLEQRTIVAYGDSITAMNRWVQPLSERLYKAYGTRYTLMNSGISGNCMSYEAKGFVEKAYGEKGVSRYQRDVLDIPHVYGVILSFGINDISYMKPKLKAKINLDLLIRDTETLAKVFKERGLRVTGQTIGPRKGFSNPLQKFTPQMEQMRQEYNRWVRECGLFDYVVDSEPLLLEPGTTDTYRKDLHQGDYLHPNKKGGKVIADAFDLEELTGEKRQETED